MSKDNSTSGEVTTGVQREPVPHTPTPWELHDAQFGDTDIRKAVAENLPGHGLPLKCVLSGDCREILHTRPIYSGAGRDLATEEANAAFIVRAVNSHAELVEALAGMVKSADELAQRYGCDRIEEHPGSVTAKARAALSKALGTEER